MPSQSRKRPDTRSPSQKQGLFADANLAFFMRERVAPLLRHIESTKTWTSPQASFVRAELLESFLWLHHGVSIEYFALPLARRVTYEFFPLFLKAYESLRSESHFETWFTSPLRAIFQSEFTGNQELFSSGRIWKRSKTALGVDAVFQAFLILANDLVQNPRARPLMPPSSSGSGIPAGAK